MDEVSVGSQNEMPQELKELQGEIQQPQTEITYIPVDELPVVPLPLINKITQNKLLTNLMSSFKRERVEDMNLEFMKQTWSKYVDEMDMVTNSSILDILIPCEEGRYINSQTIRSIENQGYDFRLWVSTKHSDGDHEKARNQVKDYGVSEFVLFLDNDLELPPNGIRAMVHFLMKPENSHVACIVLHRIELGDETIYSEYDETADYPAHVGMSCNLWRREVLEQMTFTKRGSCECKAMCEDLRANGYQIGILRGLTCTHHKSKLHKE